jgi:hypothetical protein
MSISTKLFKIDPIDFALSQAGQANKAGAFKTLKTAYALTPKQAERIRAVLNTFKPDTFGTGEPALKRDILVALSINLSSKPCHYLFAEPIADLVDLIFSQCLRTDRFEDLTALSCVNSFWHKSSKVFWAKFDIKHVHPNLKILDAAAQGIKVDDKPSIHKFKVIKNFRNLAGKIQGQRGFTVLTLCEGLTFKQLREIAAKEGITINFVGDGIEQELANTPVVKTSVIEIGNSIFIDGKKPDLDKRQECVLQYGCEEPTALELTALCIFTKKIFKESLLFETFAQSSTKVQGSTLVVGWVNSVRIDVRSYVFCDPDNIGAIGRCKLG